MKFEIPLPIPVLRVYLEIIADVSPLLVVFTDCLRILSRVVVAAPPIFVAEGCLL